MKTQTNREANRFAVCIARRVSVGAAPNLTEAAADSIVEGIFGAGVLTGTPLTYGRGARDVITGRSITGQPRSKADLFLV
jgi:hypothetical protein